MFGFIIGCVVGGAIGVFTMCCCIAGRESDEE